MKSSEIDRLLPGVFQQTLEDEHGPLRALLAVMEDLHQPVEDLLTAVDAVFDPYRTPDAFVAYLAGWLDLTYLLIEGRADDGGYVLPSGIVNLRELVNAGSELIRWRGTSRGLLQFLETATGATGFQIEDQVLDQAGLARPFHIRIDLPSEAEKYRPLIDTIVRAERPAHVTYELGPPPEAPTPPGGDGLSS
jgi:phage tail-like protein